MPDVNVLAVVVAALSSFLLGGLWYGKPLFLNAWVRESGQPSADLTASGKHPARVFGLSFLLALLAAYVFAAFLGPAPDLAVAVRTGALVGLCFVASSFGINYLFAGRSNKLWLIDGGYHAVQFTLYGLVLGLWH